MQSSTLALMAATGELEPRPDHAVFADTQSEPEAVYRWLDWLERQLPFPVHRVTAGNLAKAALEVRHSKLNPGNVYLRSMIPLYVLDGTRKGMLHRRCTAEYKIRKIIAENRRLVGHKTLTRWRKSGSTEPLVEQWIGISTDEAHRQKPAPAPWIRNRYPLIERDYSRTQCEQWLFANHIWRVPRSACVFCPYHGNDEWRNLRDNHPADFARAVQWERDMREAAKQDNVTRGELFLHADRIPLDQVDLSIDKGRKSQMGNECDVRRLSGTALACTQGLAMSLGNENHEKPST